MKRALITGINGQDGGYLAEFLLDKGYEVYGMERRSSTPLRINCQHLDDKITFLKGDLTDQNSLTRCIRESDPDEVYNLAAQSFVGESWNTPEQTSDVTGMGCLRILEAIREYGKDIKFYQASTSEMFGKMVENPANENTPFYPRSPYGVAKLYGYWIIKNYREAYNMHCSSGILFNHESPRRGETFVTRKITRGLKAISEGRQTILLLGNLNAKRDWGHAKDYAEGMWRMLQQDEPDDYVIATGVEYSVRDFVEACAPYFGFDIEWMGEGMDEIGIDKKTKKTIVAVSEKYFRPAEVERLLGDATKAKEVLGWEPKVDFKSLVKDMCENES